MPKDKYLVLRWEY